MTSNTSRRVTVPDFWKHEQPQPTTPIQALMEARPGEDPETSTIEESDETIKSLVDALVPDLSELERDILIMHVNGLSVRKIADYVGISKSEIHRKLPELLELLAGGYERQQGE